MTPGLSPEYISIELKNLRDSKLANIAITINKVIRILKLMGTKEPPIRSMNDEEVYFALWGAQDSIKDQLMEVLRTLEDCDEVQACFEFLDDSSDGPSEGAEAIDYSEKINRARHIMLFIS